MPASTFDAIGSGATVHLALMSARTSLPESTLEDLPRGAVALTDWSPKDGGWVTDCPISVRKPHKRNKQAPEGMRLLVDGEPQTYRLRKGKDDTWAYEKGRIVLRVEDPTAVKVELRAEHLASLWERLEPERSGLTGLDYMRYELTLDTHTRSGLLLPAPASATWTVAVPESAVLETGLMLVDNGLDRREGNGASLVVEVNGDEVARRFVDDIEHKPFTVDLSRWQGEQVELTLRSDPHGDTDWDHLFVASPTIVGAPTDTVRRVVVVGIDTLRYDQVTQHGYHRDTTAPLQSLADSSVIFDNSWAPAPRTRPSFRSSTTGAYPLAAIDAPTVGEIFRQAGFVTGGVTANVHLVPDMGFTDGFDFWHFENSRDADVQIRRAKAWLKDNQDRDAFLFLHLMDPHNFYRAPGTWANRYVEHEKGKVKVTMNRWKLISLSVPPESQEWLRDRYDGEVAFMAHHLAGFVKWLVDLPGETMIVLHSDHGEEFWEHGSYEHNHTLYSEVVKANLWIRPPRGWAGGHRVSQPVSLVDIAPTLYDFAGITSPPGLDGVSLRPLLDAGQADQAPELRQRLEDRPLQIGHLMYDQELWGVVAAGWKYTLRTCDGKQELYDLQEDPEERSDQVGSASPEFIQQNLRALSQATGFETGLGYRVEIIDGGPFLLDFGEGAQVSAVVMDPDACKNRRTNIEWGDTPKHWPEDVGLVTVEAGKVAFAPGDRGEGKLLVLASGPPVSVQLGSAEALEAPSLNRMLKAGGVAIRIEAGPVLLPTDSVAKRLGLPNPDLQHNADQLDALRALGYIE